MYKKITRPDGSVIILAPKKDSRSVTLEVMFKVGSRQERRQINGACHFIEHMMFKGTKRRPSTAVLSRQLDAVGAEYNAATGKDHTTYYIHVDSKRLSLAVDMLSDMLHHSKFDPSEVNRERGVIVEELNMYQDNPAMHIDEIFEGVMFSNSSLGWEIGGPREVIKKVSRASLVDFKNKYYYPGNMVIGLSGHFEEPEALLLLHKFFPVAKKRSRAVISPAKPSTTGPRAKLEYKESEQVQLMLGFPGFKRDHKDSDALLLLSVILGGTMSSRLFINIREKLGLAYDIRSLAEAFEDTGYFAVRAGLDKKRIFEALSSIRQELVRIKRGGVTAEELRRAKDNIRGRLILKFENPSVYLSYIISQELLLGKVYDLDRKLAKINAVSRKDVNRVAAKVISWPQARMALIGPFRDNKRFLSIIK